MKSLRNPTDPVLPIGPQDSCQIAIVGEAPGKQEMQEGVPFIGPSGNVLNRALLNAGIDRKACYITNVLKTRPPKGDFSKIPPKDLAAARLALLKELRDCSANIILLLGSEALKSVTGKDGILNWRGSLLSTPILGTHRKVMATVHPAAALRKYCPYLQMLEFDTQRLACEMHDPALHRTPRACIVPTNAYEVRQALEHIREVGPDRHLAVDIESTIGTNHIISIGFSNDIELGVSFLLTPGSYTDGAIGKEAAHQACLELLANPAPKVFQNGCNFDIPLLIRRGYPVNNYAFDTFCGAHQLYVELPRSLDFLTSIYTDMPYYKNMLGEATQGGTMNSLVLGRYNCYDTMVTLEIALAQIEEMGATGVAFHKKFYIDLLAPLLEAQLEGVQIDLTKRAQVKLTLEKERGIASSDLAAMIPSGFLFSKQKKEIAALVDKQASLQESGKDKKKDGTPTKNFLNLLDKICHYTFNFNPASPEQVADVLYKAFKLNKRVRHGRVTTDDAALKRILASKVKNEQASKFIQALLAHRASSKLIDTYLEAKVDTDNRMRCSYNIGKVKTGRLSSQKNVFGTGCNLQNIPKRKGRAGLIRSLYIPDEGHKFVSADLSQAEARVVAWLAGETDLMERFASGKGIFEFVASSVFNVLEEKVSKTQRNIAKTLVHGTNYGMKTRKFAFTAGITEAEAEKIWRKYCVQFPRLSLWRDRITDQIERERVLVTPFGRHRTFFDRVTNKTRVPDQKGGYFINKTYRQEYLRDAWSYIPQSTVGDLLNLGMVATHNEILKQTWPDTGRPRFRLQVHDQVVYSCPTKSIEQLTKIMNSQLSQTININHKPLSIPIEVEVGKDWSEI